MDCSRGFGYFPDEVILQILARLPIKFLYRAKSVCKRWYNLSSCEYFVKVYDEASVRRSMVLVEVSELSDSIPSFICVERSWGVSELSLNFLRDRIDVRSSCNGLLCCSSVPDKGVYYVCNPITREFKVLPRNRAGPINPFHPSDEATLVGLACDVGSRTYSVVLAGYRRMFGHRPDGSFVCFVFDSRSDKWRKFISMRDDRFGQIHKNQGVFVSGAVHWLTDSPSCILAIDLQYDVCRKVCLPEQLNEHGHRIYLLELDGRLSVVEILENWMNIWVLKCYEAEIWELLDRVSLRCIQGLAPGIFPISQSEDYMFFTTRKQVLLYNRKRRTWKEMYSVKNGSVLPLWYKAHAFRSSLFSCS
ncbi:hypothetical protein MLD38_036000 [Melastoma candidum]|uniref:Uncharacterized protein n=1 Tax=Melastoma candidum TaxID=119954 RepID=A0ACB9LIB4_9MYRT|nr:hypothetical protein MLD38_036000 [Melastoma candidum]